MGVGYRKARIVNEETPEEVSVEWRTLGEGGDNVGWPTRAAAQGYADNRWRLYQQKYIIQRRETTPWKEA